MTSLLCRKSNTGLIVAGDQELCDHLLNDHPKSIPYLIKEKKEESIDDFTSQATSVIGLSKSNMNSIKNGTSLKNSVMFNIPATPNITKPATQSNCKPTRANHLTVKSTSIQNMTSNHEPNVRRRELNASSTILSSAPPTHSSMSTTSNIDKQFNSNNTFQHEKKKISKKKLKGIQQQLENRLTIKSATTTDLYKELNKIVDAEKSFAQKMNVRIDECEREKLRKREVIYKNWYRNVYEPMQTEIYKTMLSENAEYARNIRNVKYLEYLSQCNKRNYVYQDDFEPSEYDPVNMFNLDASVTGQTFSDPTLLSQRKELKEVNMINQEIRLPIITKYDSPRSDVVWNNWILDQYNTINSKVRAKSAKKCNTSRHSSEYNLEWDRGNPLNKGLLVNSTINNTNNSNSINNKNNNNININNSSNSNNQTSCNKKYVKKVSQKATQSCLDFNNNQINFIGDEFKCPSVKFELKPSNNIRTAVNQK